MITSGIAAYEVPSLILFHSRGKVRVSLPVAGMEAEPWAQRGWASPTVTLVLSRAWTGPGLLWGPMLSSMAPLEPGQLWLSLNKFPNSAVLLASCLLLPAPHGGGPRLLWAPNLPPPTPGRPYSPPCSFLFPVQCATPSPPTSPASPAPPANPLSSESPRGAESSHAMRV